MARWLPALVFGGSWPRFSANDTSHQVICLFWLDPGSGHILLGLAPLAPSLSPYLFALPGFACFSSSCLWCRGWLAWPHGVAGVLLGSPLNAFLLALCPQQDFKPFWDRGFLSTPYHFITARLHLFIAAAIKIPGKPRNLLSSSVIHMRFEEMWRLIYLPVG